MWNKLNAWRHACASTGNVYRPPIAVRLFLNFAKYYLNTTRLLTSFVTCSEHSEFRLGCSLHDKNDLGYNK